MLYAVGADKKANGPSATNTQPALSNGLFGQPAPVRILAQSYGPPKPCTVDGPFPVKANMTSGVYWIYQQSLDRALYVGSSQNVAGRIKAHIAALRRGKHPNVHLQRTWDKYGSDDIQFAPLEAASVDRLAGREQFWLEALAPTCNVAICTEAAARGAKRSDETRRKISLARKGTKLSEAHKRSIALGGTGKRGRNNGWTGRKHTDEEKEKISAAQRGIKRGPLSDEHKQKISRGERGRKLTDAHRQKISEAAKQRRRKDNGQYE